MFTNFVGDWRWIALRGLVAVAFGVATLAWPGVTLWALVLLFGIFVLADGILALATAIGGAGEGRIWWALYGIAAVAAGIVTLVWPEITGLALLYVIAIWAFAHGVVHLATAVRLREELDHAWALAALGVLAIAFGVLLVITPGAGALVITWAIGWYAILYGILLFVVAWMVYADTREPRSRKAGMGTPHPAT